MFRYLFNKVENIAVFSRSVENLISDPIGSGLYAEFDAVQAAFRQSVDRCRRYQRRIVLHLKRQPDLFWIQGFKLAQP